MRDYECKLIQHGFILYCKIGGKSLNREDKSNLIKVTGRIGLTFHEKLFANSGWKKFCFEGLLWIAPLIESKLLADEKITFVLEKLEVIFVDFQPEFLKLAIAHWVASNLEFDLPQWESDYNRLTNEMKFILK